VNAITYLATVRRVRKRTSAESSAVLVYRRRLRNQQPGPDRRGGVYLWDWEQKVTLLPGHCACGSAMLRVADIAGRRDDDSVMASDWSRERVPVCGRHRPVSLARYGLSNPELSISIVEEIPRHASTGKLKRFIAPSG
jgi:hypothetical protein